MDGLLSSARTVRVSKFQVSSLKFQVSSFKFQYFRPETSHLRVGCRSPTSALPHPVQTDQKQRANDSPIDQGTADVGLDQPPVVDHAGGRRHIHEPVQHPPSPAAEPTDHPGR